MLQQTSSVKKNIALIGLGDIAKKAYLPIVAAHGAIAPILVTRNLETLDVLSRKYRIDKKYQTLNELLISQPDAAMIHSATPTHFTMAKQLLAANIPTFVDKPLSFDIDECRQLVTLAREQNVPLFVAMNRRYAPLIGTLKLKKPVHVRWQKNRDNILSSAIDTIFNDFIHVVDGLLFLSGATLTEAIKTLTVDTYFVGEALGNISIRFSAAGALFEGSMNRVAGINEERIEYFSEHCKTEIENLTHGYHVQSGKRTQLGFSDWQSYLHTRGFEDMLADWLRMIDNSGGADQTHLDSVLATHELCQVITDKSRID